MRSWKPTAAGRKHERIMPQEFITGMVIEQYDGTYANPNPFNKPDGFYIPVPVQ